MLYLVASPSNSSWHFHLGSLPGKKLWWIYFNKIWWIKPSNNWKLLSFAHFSRWRQQPPIPTVFHRLYLVQLSFEFMESTLSFPEESVKTQIQAAASKRWKTVVDQLFFFVYLVFRYEMTQNPMKHVLFSKFNRTYKRNVHWSTTSFLLHIFNLFIISTRQHMNIKTFYDFASSGIIL